MSFHVQKWPDISNGCSDIPSKKERKRNKKREEEGGRRLNENIKERDRKKSWDQVFRQKEVLCWD